MGLYIKGMEMPTTGLYFVSVDNTGGRDKTIATVERMLGNCDVRQIVGSFELIPVQQHGRLIDAADVLNYTMMLYKENWMNGTGVEAPAVWKKDIDTCPTIIEAEEGE